MEAEGKFVKVEDIFRSGLSSDAEEWFTRDGRRVDKASQRSAEKFFEEHLKSLDKRKDQDIKKLNEIRFKVSIIDVEKDTEKSLEEPQKKDIKFSNLCGMPKQLGENIKRLQFGELTPIQRIVIPYMQNGKDIVACSETGSGKTVAYLFPMIGNMLVKGLPKNPYIIKGKFFRDQPAYPLSLILVPTRELAEQVYKESQKMAFMTGIRTVAVYGGSSKGLQLRELSLGCDILIATPGRLNDFLGEKKISLKMVSSLILDEADRMLDMGFLPQLKDIVCNFDMPTKTQRQNLLFSATFSKEVQQIARNILKNYYYVKAISQAPKQVSHEFIECEEGNKTKELMNILKENPKEIIIIFVATKKGADEVCRDLNDSGFLALAIHGDKNQFQRETAIKKFSNEEIKILVATDVASRGLDFPNISIVLNYDLPHFLEDYIHRTGRTGRVGQTGRAISFVTEKDCTMLPKIKGFIISIGQKVPSWFDALSSGNSFKTKFRGRYPKRFDSRSISEITKEKSPQPNSRNNRRFGEKKGFRSYDEDDYRRVNSLERSRDEDNNW
ncbi:MAG: DEAD/DEAH box helicase [archaeon]|nr:DEAD/DEAH box helicase [archaeon]